MEKKRVFGELEMAILKLFKPHQKQTVRDILQALGDVDKYTTIMTVMNRLVEKKQLYRQRVGHQYEYWLNLKAESPSHSLLGKIKQRIFGGKSVSLLSYLIESDEITDEELKEMEKIIANAREARKL